MKIKKIQEMTEHDIMHKALEEEDVRFLVKWYFDYDLTSLQCGIVREIAFEKYNRFSISAMTRYGKSFCVTIAIGLYFILNKNKKVFFISPTQEQSMILRDYMAELVLKCRSLQEIADINITGEERLRAQTSRAHQTFKNGCSYRVFTAHGDAENLMGHGLGSNGGILIVDEACLVGSKAYAKIMRILGDNPEKSMFIELYNPWNRDNKAFEHTLNPEFHCIRISYLDAIKEGRTTKEFIEQRRLDMTPLEFTVLYESKFPVEAEDSIFNLDRIKDAIEIGKENFTSPKLIISCDVADKGNDFTIIMSGIQHKDTNNFLIQNIYSEPKSENTEIAGRINNIINVNKSNFESIVVNIDCIGVGTGVVSMVKEYVEENHLGHVVVNRCHFGETPELEPERFYNKKAENYFRLKELMEKGMIGIPDDKDLLKQLISMRWKFSSTSKIVVVDPDKSPDFADALVYFTWYIKPVYEGRFFV